MSRKDRHAPAAGQGSRFECRRCIKPRHPRGDGAGSEDHDPRGGSASGLVVRHPQADSADLLLVMARTSGEGNRGISTFILEKGMPGLKMGKKEEKMGLNSSHTMEVILDDVKVLFGTTANAIRFTLHYINCR